MTLQHQPQIGALHLDGSPQPVCPSMGNVPQAEGIAPRRSKRKFHKEIVETDKPERGHVIQEMIFKMPFLPDRSHINTARLTRLALSRKVSSAPRHKEKWHPKSSFEEATLGTHCFWNKVIPVAPDPDYKTQSSVPQRQSAALSSSPSLSTSATGADCSCSSLSSADMLVSQTWIILMRSFLEHTWKLLYLPSGLHQTNRLLNSNRTFASIPFLESNSTRHEMHYLRTLAKSNDETSPTSSRYDMLSYVMTVTSKDKHHRMTAQISGPWSYLCRVTSQESLYFEMGIHASYGFLMPPIKHVTNLTRNHLSSRAWCAHHFRTAR